MPQSLDIDFRKMLTDPYSVAKLTFFMAVLFSFIVALSIILVYVLQEYTVFVSGDLMKSVKLRGNLSSYMSNNGEIFFSVRDPTTRPRILVRDSVFPLVKLGLVSFDDTGTVVGGVSLAACNITVKSKGKSVIATYFYNRRLIATKILGDQEPVLIIHGKLQVLQLDSSVIKSVRLNKYDNSVDVHAYFPYLNLNYYLKLSFEYCKVEGYKITPNLNLRLYINSSDTCVIKLSKVDMCFAGTTEYGERRCYPSPFFSKLSGFLIYGGLNYMIVLLSPILALIAWKKIIKNNLYNFKGLLVYNLMLALMGSTTALHWDAVMSFIFASKALNPVDLYSWTRINQIAVKLKIPSHYPMFAGYTYITPWIAFLLFPLSFIQNIFIPKGFLHVFSYDVFILGEYLIWFFRASYMLDYLCLGLWYMLFNMLTYTIAIRMFEKENVLSFMYSPFLALVSYYWKMFEPMLLALFVAMIYLIFKKRKFYFMAGGLASIISTKVYTVFTIFPILKTLDRRRLLMGILGFLVFSIPTLFTILSFGIKKFLFVTLYYQSHREIAAVNFFPIVFSEPLGIVKSLGNLSFIIEALLIGYLLIELIKYSKIDDVKDYLAWGATLMVPYMIFNKLVSPQNYLFLLFISYILGLVFEASLISLLLTLYVILVFPSVFYFAMPLTPLLGKLYYQASTKTFYTILTFYFNVVRPVSWTVLIVNLFAADSLLLAKLLRFVRKGKEKDVRRSLREPVGMRSGR